MEHKHKVNDIYVSFAHMIATQFSGKTKIFRSDSSGEYTSTRFCKFLSQQGSSSSYPVPKLQNRMVLLNANIVTYWTLFVPFFICLKLLLNSGEQSLHLFYNKFKPESSGCFSSA